MTEPAQWAIERALELCARGPDTIYLGAWFNNVARYIEQHEQQPVDPDLLLAREACAQAWEDDEPEIAHEYRAGKMDASDDKEMKAALRAIKLKGEGI